MATSGTFACCGMSNAVRRSRVCITPVRCPRCRMKTLPVNTSPLTKLSQREAACPIAKQRAVRGVLPGTHIRYTKPPRRNRVEPGTRRRGRGILPNSEEQRLVCACIGSCAVHMCGDVKEEDTRKSRTFRIFRKFENGRGCPLSGPRLRFERRSICRRPLTTAAWQCTAARRPHPPNLRYQSDGRCARSR